MAKKWMPEEEKLLLDQKETLSTREMAAKFGVTQKAISDKLRRLSRRATSSPSAKTQPKLAAARSSHRLPRRSTVRPTVQVNHTVAVQHEMPVTGAIPGLDAKGERFLRTNAPYLLDSEIADLFGWVEEDVSQKLALLSEIRHKNGIGAGVSPTDPWLDSDPVTLTTCARCDVQYHIKFITGFTDCSVCRPANIKLWFDSDLPARALHS